METYRGKRLAAFTFVIRVNQLEVRLDKDIGCDEAALHSPETMERVRDIFADVLPGSRVTWAFSYRALIDTRDNYAAIRRLAARYMETYGDEVTFLPGAFFSNVYNTPEEINETVTTGVRLVETLFGRRPRSIVSGYMAAGNQRFLAEKLDIHVCQGQIWSQMGIDNGDGDGGVLYPYYPSVSHYLKPAQNREEQIDCVCFDGWTVDLVSATRYGLSKTHNSRLGLGPIETVMKFGPEEGLREQLATIDVHFDRGLKDNGFGLVTVNWELCLFGGEEPLVRMEWLRQLLERMKAAYPDVCAETLADIGLAWRRENPDNAAWDYRFEQRGSGVGCSDPDKQVIWRMNKTFRLGFLEERGARTLRVMDFTDYTAAYAEPEPGNRDWSLWGLLNQKGTRPQDVPVAFGDLPAAVRERVLARYPDLPERLERRTMFDKAAWIWHEDGETVNQYVDFAANFIAGEGRRALLRISADSGYRAFLNGVSLDAAQYPDYPAYKVYDEIEVTALLRPGRNRLGIVGYCQNEDSSVYRRGSPALLFELEQDGQLVCRSGTDTLCRRSLDYISGSIDKFSDQLSFGFSYDAESADDWLTPDTHLHGFEAARLVPGERYLVPRPVERLEVDDPAPVQVRAQGVFRDEDGDIRSAGERMQRAFLSCRPLDEMGGETRRLPFGKPLRLSASGGHGMYVVLDLGREEAGYFHLDIETDEPCEIVAGFGEHLEDLRVRSAVGGRRFAVCYRAKAGRQTFTHTFKRLGLRYLQLHIYTERITLYYAGVRPAHYPVRYKPAFCCGDGLHNRIYEVSRRTLELCMHEHYEDCPWREQALYAMDARIQMLCGYCVFEGTDYAQASLRLLALGQRADGLLELCAPARVPVVIPAFSLCFIVAVYENRQHGGRVAFAEEMLPVIERILAWFLSRRDDAGLVPREEREELWHFYEWSSGLDGMKTGADYEAPLQFFLIMALKAAEKLYEDLNRREDAARCLCLHRELTERCAVFLDRKTGLYATYLSGGQRAHFAALTQALAVCAGVCPDDVLTGLLRTLADGGELIPLTLSSYWYKYEALMRFPEEYRHYVLDDVADTWGRMLWQGATSFWETEAGASDFADAGSLCHGWSAIPVYVYHHYR